MLYSLLQLTADGLDALGLEALVRVFYKLEFRAFIAVVLAFGIVLALGRRTIRWLVKQKVGDRPEFHNKDLNELMASRANTPTMGGVLIVGAILATTLLLADLGQRTVHLAIVVAVWLAGVGLADDWLKLTTARRHPGSRAGLHAWEKLLFQLGLGLVVGWFLYRHGIGSETAHVVTLPFQRTYQPGSFVLQPGVIVLGPVAFVTLAILVIAGTSNAVNLTDGMDGLATGTMIVASFAMLALCFVAGNEQAALQLMYPCVPGAGELMIVTGAMAGACLGFLWFNCAPAQVFMGDTGSLALGGLLAYVAVAIRQEFLLVVIGGVFFMEMGSVILQVGYFKWTKGRRIFRIAPIHHHFHLGGWSEHQVVIRFWVLGVILAMLALVSLRLR